MKQAQNGGRHCSVCACPRRATIENQIRRGVSSASLANTYGWGRTMIRWHAEKHMGLALVQRPGPDEAQMAADAERIVRRIGYAGLVGVTLDALALGSSPQADALAAEIAATWSAVAAVKPKSTPSSEAAESDAEPSP